MAVHRGCLTLPVLERPGGRPGDGNDVQINFNPDVPNSKYKSAGFDLTIPDFFAPGSDLILSPLVTLDGAFPAHANCHNLNP